MQKVALFRKKNLLCITWKKDLLVWQTYTLLLKSFSGLDYL